MVFVQVGGQLTEEEKLLQQKYQMLKRKKKQLVRHKAPKIEKPDLINQIPLKRTEASKQDAKEAAKRLLKSGAIQVAKIAEKERQDQGFKRAKSLMRKRIGIDRPAPFRPFSSSSSRDSNEFEEPLESKALPPSPPSSPSSFTPSSSASNSNLSSPATPHSWNSIAANYYKRSASKDSENRRETIAYDDL